MTSSSHAAPLYRLFEDELDREILAALDLEGFFTAGSTDSAPRFIGTPLPLGAPPQRFDDVELRVVSAAGEVLAYYYIGTTDLQSAQPSDAATGSTDALVSFRGYSLPYPGAREFWRRWASRVPIERGEWRSHPPELYDSWLHVVQQAWFASGHRATRYSDETHYVIDGAGMANIAGFYCALGEAINGPGGYFGSNPNALEDCLSSDKAKRALIRLTWQNFRLSERSIAPDELMYALNALRDSGVVLECES